MLDIHHDESRPSSVRVAFEDVALSFMLSKGATFEDLADRLRDLDERHHGKPVAIEVKLAASPDAERRRFVSGLGRSLGTGTAPGIGIATSTSDTRSGGGKSTLIVETLYKALAKRLAPDLAGGFDHEAQHRIGRPIQT